MSVEKAFYGSFLPIPSADLFPIPERTKTPLAGAVICKTEKIKLNVGRPRWMVEVKNEGDRPIQVSASRIVGDTRAEMVERLARITCSLRPTRLSSLIGGFLTGVTWIFLPAQRFASNLERERRSPWSKWEGRSCY